jgi:hypothetical protein
MQTRLELKFHRGQEFTKKDNSHIHCIVLSYVARELAYLVTYTSSGHLKKVTESDLTEFYKPADVGDKLAALARLGASCTSMKDDADENGALLSPNSDLLKE